VPEATVVLWLVVAGSVSSSLRRWPWFCWRRRCPSANGSCQPRLR